MRVSEPLDAQGLFWLPTKPDDKLPGKLAVSKSGEVSLRLQGMFGDDLSSGYNDIPIILGITERGKHLTFVDCYETNKSISFPGIPAVDIFARWLLIGFHFSKEEDLLFSKVHFHIEGLDEWLGVTGISTKYDREKQEAEIAYKQPQQISQILDGGFTFLIRFTWTTTIATKYTYKATITQEAVLSLETPALKKISELTDYVWQINNLLCLALDQPVALSSVHVTRSDIVEDVGEEKRPIEIEVYYQSRPHPDTPPSVHRPRMLFTYEDVESNFGAILTKWLDGYRQHEPAFNLYFAATTAKHAFLETEFLFLAQGLEALHRRMIGGSKDTKVYLKERLVDLLKPLAKYFGDDKKNESMVDEIVKTRHYLTHYDPTLEGQSKVGTDLWRLCAKMEVLYGLHLLRQIGFSSDQIDRIVSSNYWMKAKLKDKT